jgi:hypothetical protein
MWLDRFTIARQTTSLSKQPDLPLCLTLTVFLCTAFNTRIYHAQLTFPSHQSWTHPIAQFLPPTTLGFPNFCMHDQIAATPRIRFPDCTRYQVLSMAIDRVHLQVMLHSLCCIQQLHSPITTIPSFPSSTDRLQNSNSPTQLAPIFLSHSNTQPSLTNTTTQLLSRLSHNYTHLSLLCSRLHF